MSHPFFAYIARMRYIVRWGLMRNTMQENIQEHSHMVAVLAHALAVIRRDKFGGTVDPGRVAAVALYHDAPEIFTGDLPTPVKYANPAIQTAYKAVEADAAQRLVAMLPQEMRPAFAALLEESDPGGAGFGEGRRRALGPSQVPGGTEGGQPGVPVRRPANPRGPGRLPPAGAGLFPGGVSPRLSPHPGRTPGRRPGIGSPERP